MSTVAEKCKTNHNSENKITNYKRKRKSKKHNNNPENIITSQKTQRQIRQTGRGRYSLRQRYWFGNRLLTADWTRHLSIKVQEEPEEAQQSLLNHQMINLLSCVFDAIDQWFDPVFCQTFFSSLFKSHIAS